MVYLAFLLLASLYIGFLTDKELSHLISVTDASEYVGPKVAISMAATLIAVILFAIAGFDQYTLGVVGMCVLFAVRLSMGWGTYYFTEFGVNKETFKAVLAQEVVLIAPFLFLATSLYYY